MGGNEPMAARILGIGVLPPLTVWHNIDFLKVNLVVGFCFQVLCNIKTTWFFQALSRVFKQSDISRPSLYHRRASPTAPKAHGVWVWQTFLAFFLYWYDVCLCHKESIKKPLSNLADCEFSSRYFWKTSYR